MCLLRWKIIPVLINYDVLQIDILMPDTGKCPDDLLKDISAQQVYLVKNLPLGRLINVEFIEAFVKRGN